MSGTVKRPFVSKWLLLLAILVLPAKASAQSVIFFTDRALGVNPLSSTPVFLSYAPVRVCSLPLTQLQPCLPLANITDFNGNTLSNSIGGAFGQLTTDVVGRFTFGCSVGGNYQVQVASSGSNTPSLNYPITCSSGVTSVALGQPNTWTGNQTFQGNNTYSGAGTFTGNNTYSGTETLANLDAIQFVDGVTNTTVQAALNKLPTGGGIVYIPPGTYAGPTSAPTNGWNGVRVVCLAGSLTPVVISLTGAGAATYSAANNCILQYTTGLTISLVANMAFDHIIFDFQNTASISNLTLTSVAYSYFNLAAINCSVGSACITLNTTGSNQGTLGNHFFRLIAHTGTSGTASTSLLLQGNCATAVPCSGASVVTENTFDWVQLFNDTTGGLGLDFNEYCDSNRFENIGIWIKSATNFTGMRFNGQNTTQDWDADLIDIGHADATATGGQSISTGHPISAGKSFGNFIRNGVFGGWAGGANYPIFSTDTSATANSPSYMLDDMGNGTAGYLQGYHSSSFYSDGWYTTPSHFWRQCTQGTGCVTKWQVYNDAGNNWEVNNGTQNQFAVAATNGGGFFLNGTSGSVQVTPQATASGQLLLPNPVNSPATMVQTVASGTATMTTAAITAGNCGTTVTVAATNVVTTDTITFAFNAAPAGSNAGLVAWPTAGNVNFAYCPNSAETPAAATVNWKVLR